VRLLKKREIAADRLRDPRMDEYAVRAFELNAVD